MYIYMYIIYKSLLCFSLCITYIYIYIVNIYNITCNYK